jgi:hypothetical protein
MVKAMVKPFSSCPLCVQASWIARHKEELARLRKAEVEGKQREATLLAQNTRLGTQVSTPTSHAQ